jgi:hypothetical protein
VLEGPCKQRILAAYGSGGPGVASSPPQPERRIVLSVARKHATRAPLAGMILRIGFVMRQRSGAVSLHNRPDFFWRYPPDEAPERVMRPAARRM